METQIKEDSVMELAQKVCDTCHDEMFGYCPICSGTGALIFGLRTLCAHSSTKFGMEYCVHCEGRNWVLVPKSEQQEAMEDYCDKNYWDWSLSKVGPDRCPDPYYVIRLGDRSPYIALHTQTRKEALAKAILLSI